MITSFGSMNLYADATAETAYPQERTQRDFAAINHAAQVRADRRARAAELHAAGQPASEPTRGLTWVARVQRIARPATR